MQNVNFAINFHNFLNSGNRIIFNMFGSHHMLSSYWRSSVAPELSSPQVRRFIVYLDPETQCSRVGLLDNLSTQIQPISLPSCMYISSIYQIIGLGTHPVAVKNDGSPVSLDSVQVLPPLPARDVFTIMRKEVAPRFKLPCFDPTEDPAASELKNLKVIKRPSSAIIPHGGKLLLKAGGYYAGEIGVIVSSKAYMVTESEAWGYVWGFTILNGVHIKEAVLQKRKQQTSQNMQHEPLYSMGPVAIPKECLSQFQCFEVHINGTKVHEFPTEYLITEIPKLVKTVSLVETLHPGDVIATQLSVFNSVKPDLIENLKQGDTISVTVPGIGTLSNIIEVYEFSNNKMVDLPNPISYGKYGLTSINGKPLNFQVKGYPMGKPIVFIHGLGGSMESFGPLIAHLGLENTHTMHLLDLEGHGKSPTQPQSVVNAVSLAQDVLGIFQHAGLTEHSRTTIIAHSMGCFPAVLVACQHPTLVEKVILLGPPPFRLSDARKEGSRRHAEEVRKRGMSTALEMMLATAGVSAISAKRNPLALTAVRLSVLGQSLEGHAKAVGVFATLPDWIDFQQMKARLLIATGEEDRVCPPQTASSLSAEFPNSTEPIVLPSVGHWHVFEDPENLAAALKPFILS